LTLTIITDTVKIARWNIAQILWKNFVYFAPGTLEGAVQKERYLPTSFFKK